MEQIVQSLTVGEHGQEIDARVIHKALEITYSFSTWLNKRIRAYKFELSKDYRILGDLVHNSGRGRPGKIYMITIDMAKELCLIENNEKGRTIRRQLIAYVEKSQLAFKEIEKNMRHMQMKIDELSKPKKKRVKGKTKVYLTEVEIRTDMFGNEYAFKSVYAKDVDQMTDSEMREFRVKHRNKVMKGLAKSQEEDLKESVFSNVKYLKPSKERMHELNPTT